MKLAYIIIAHHNFPQFRRLVERLNKPGVSFIFRISGNCQEGIFEQVQQAYGSEANVRFAKRQSIYWGNFSIVRAMINSIAALVKSGFDYEYAIALSGQDYPLASHDEICATIAAGNGKQFLEYFNTDTMESDDAHRYLSHHLWLKNHHWWYPHTNQKSWITRIYNAIVGLILPERRTLPHGYAGFKGSFWWHLTPDCIEYLDSFLKSSKGKDFIRYFTYTYHAAEFFFHTILLNSPYKDQIINQDNHYAVWFTETGHPKTFTLDDYETIMASGKLFGRKFELNGSTELFDKIDAAAEN